MEDGDAQRSTSNARKAGGSRQPEKGWRLKAEGGEDGEWQRTEGGGGKTGMRFLGNVEMLWFEPCPWPIGTA